MSLLFSPIEKVKTGDQDVNGRFCFNQLLTRSSGEEKKLKEIPVSKRNVIVAVILAVVIAVGILVIQNWPLRTEQVSTPSTSEDGLASAAAASAIENVFQVDYQEGKEAWLKRICEVSTPVGCELISASADRMWEKYMDAKSVVSATAQATEKVAENGSEQVWQITITLSSPLPGSNKTEDIAYVVLVKTDNGWKFDRFLMGPEINAILARQKITGTPAEEGKQ